MTIKSSSFSWFHEKPYLKVASWKDLSGKWKLEIILGRPCVVIQPKAHEALFAGGLHDEQTVNSHETKSCKTPIWPNLKQKSSLIVVVPFPVGWCCSWTGRSAKRVNYAKYSMLSIWMSSFQHLHNRTIQQHNMPETDLQIYDHVLPP